MVNIEYLRGRNSKTRTTYRGLYSIQGDLESWEVISPIRYVMEVIFDSGLDEVFKPAKMVRREYLYRPVRDAWNRTLNTFVVPHITPERNLVLDYVLEYRYICGRVSFNYSDPVACGKHDFSTHPLLTSISLLRLVPNSNPSTISGTSMLGRLVGITM